MKGTILIVEDDAAIAEGLQLNLRLEGFEPIIAPDGETALALLAERSVDLILLDISLPGISGLDVLGRLRTDADATPVILLSARRDEYDKVAALRLGGDDYVTKPFGVAELLARIASVLRRSAPQRPADRAGRPRLLRFGHVTVDLDKRVVTRHDRCVEMTHLEFELLAFLVQNAGRVLDRRELLAAVWGGGHGGSARTVDNFVGQLRNKIEADPERPEHIVTVRGSGYRFDE